MRWTRETRVEIESRETRVEIESYRADRIEGLEVRARIFKHNERWWCRVDGPGGPEYVPVSGHKSMEAAKKRALKLVLAWLEERRKEVLAP